LKDVKEYNHFCGKLIYAFGVAAMITFGLMLIFSGWVSLICTILLIAEAYVMVKIYAKKEITFFRPR